MNKYKMIEDFMNSFIDNTPEPDIDEEYFEIEKKYEELFGHFVPRAMLPDSISTESIKDAMKKCIDAKKDILFDLLGVKNNADYIY